MSSVRMFRPLARAALQRQPLAVARPVFAAAMSTKNTRIAVPSVSEQLKTKKEMTPVKATAFDKLVRCPTSYCSLRS